MTHFARALLILPPLFLSACCGTDRDYREPGHIIEISFMGAHEERRCTKSCSNIPVPDRWYIKACDDRDADHGGGCRTLALEHAPWAWEREGAAVEMIWTRNDCGWRLARLCAAEGRCDQKS